MNEWLQVIDQVAPDSIFNNAAALQAMDEIVIRTLKDTFLKTDKDFITTSPHPQHGSTATTALLLGKRLYCANVGDSRTMLCRYTWCISAYSTYDEKK
jgi:protein phosphatase 1L